jgi:hypothetical protein
MIRANQVKTTKVYNKSIRWDPEYRVHVLNGATEVVALTNMTPKFVGQEAIVINPDSTFDCTVKAGAGVTFDGSNNLATFDTAMDNITLIAASLTRWAIQVNNGVTFSSA